MIWYGPHRDCHFGCGIDGVWSRGVPNFCPEVRNQRVRAQVHLGGKGHRGPYIHFTFNNYPQEMGMGGVWVGFESLTNVCYCDTFGGVYIWPF